MPVEVWFRHADRRVPFVWEIPAQPPARWHAGGRGPAQYASDTPEGAWAEFVRHEGITDPADLAGVSRSLWALDVEVDGEDLRLPDLPERILFGGESTYPECQNEADRLRNEGATGLIAPTAALLPGSACGETVDSGELQDGPPKDGRTLCLFGVRRQLIGHRCVEGGQPPERVLALTRPLT